MCISDWRVWNTLMSKNKSKKKLSKAGKIILDVILVLALCMAGFSGYMLFKETERYRIAEASYKDLKETVLVKKEDIEDNSKHIDWEALWAINPDLRLWITMDGSQIDYPVIYPEDNVYYLKHLPDGTYNDNGTVFVDAGNNRDLVDRNTVLYGHHMLQDPPMFAELENFKDQAYADEHKEIHLYSPDDEWIVYPVGGFVSNGMDDYVQLSFSSDEEYEEYINMLQSRSVFSSDVTLTKDDKMVMLSTCSYDVYDGRFALFGKVEKVVKPGTTVKEPAQTKEPEPAKEPETEETPEETENTEEQVYYWEEPVYEEPVYEEPEYTEEEE